jgi:exodeoxyribonuclease VII large subunit
MMTPLRLSELSDLIRLSLQERFAWQRFWVVAEITNHTYYGNKGFHYFDLVETEEPVAPTTRMPRKSKAANSLVAKISGVAWREGAIRIRAFEQETGQQFGNELQVLIEVSVDYHPVYGLKLTLLDIDSRFTLGQLERKKQATIQRLLVECPDFVWESEGQLQSANKELYLPPVIQRIAVVSSKNAAGYEDFLHSLETNSLGYKFEIHPFFATVQGEQHALELAATIAAIETRALELEQDYDALVVIRGGGAATDLLIFDQFEVAEAIAACPFPVFTGIGHQKNETIADLLAHTAFKTPTKVAEYIIERNRGYETGLTTLLHQVELFSRQLVAEQFSFLDRVRFSLSYRTQELLNQQQQRLREMEVQVRKQPQRLVNNQRLLLQEMKTSLQVGSTGFIRTREKDLLHLMRLFRMSSPEKLLARGFALVVKEGRVLANPESISPGDRIQFLFAGTQLDAVIENKKEYNGDPFNL